jgi:hypothetical protein
MLRPLQIAFALAYVGAQIGLIATAGSRADGAFGFRMFSESSELEAHLVREVGEGEVPVVGGEWIAHDRGGAPRRIKWTDRVRRRELATFDTRIHASYGARAQIARWQAAVEDVASHTPEDAETRRLSVDLVIRRNGREAETVRVSSAPRAR